MRSLFERMRVSTPRAYRFDLLDGAYHEAFEKEIGIYGSRHTNTMMVEIGGHLYCVDYIG